MAQTVQDGLVVTLESAELGDLEAAVGEDLPPPGG